MITPYISVRGKVNSKVNIKGKIGHATEKLYPDLEDLHIVPSGEEQHFKSEKYGFDNITVDAVESEELNIMPTTQDQVHEGLYKKVSVPGSPDMLPENIADGKEIFGVKGTGKIADFVITDGHNLCAYGHRQEIAQKLLNLCRGITTAYYMFNDCKNITELDVSKLDTSQCKNMSGMFYRCNNLKKIDVSNFDTNNVTNMSDMFSMCSSLTELDVSNFDTSQCKDMSGMFYSCKALTELDVSNFDTSNVTDMGQMFRELWWLTELDVSNFNTSNVTDTNYMFESLREVTDLDLSNWDLGRVNSCGSMFSKVSKLVNFKSFKNLGKGFTLKTANTYSHTLHFKESNKLSHESLMDIINNLYDLNLTYDVANGGTLYKQTLQLGSTNLSKLTDSELQIAYDKGWNVT